MAYCLLVAKTLLLTVCVFFALSDIFFSLWRNNYYSMVGSTFLGIVCVLLLQMNARYLKGKLFEKYSRATLTGLMLLGCGVFLLAAAGFVYFLVSATTLQQGFQIEDDGFFFACIPTALACFWSVVLAYDSRRFRALMDEQNSGRPSTSPSLEP